MKNFMRWNFVLVLALLASGCASLNSVSLTPIPPQRQKVVKTTKTRWIVLGLNFDNDFIDSAVDDLKSQCPAGKVTGVLTKDEDYLYFLYLVFKKQLTVTGFCQDAKSTAAVESVGGKGLIAVHPGRGQ